MKIERIELYNFGSYEELNTFDIETEDASKRIVIIGGKNGAGKTTLFTAMQVCLYGHASFGFKTSGKRYLKEIYDLINNQARLDESKNAYVKICLSESRIDTDHYEIVRSWSWSNSIVHEKLSVKQNGKELDEEATLNFQKYLLHLIPPELHKLYFFDGERIAEYFLDEQRNNIKDALLVLSGNDTYEILYNNVRRLLNGVESDSESIAQNYADQKEVLAKYRQNETELLAQLSEIIADIERLEADLRKENEEYATGGGITLEEWKYLQRKLKDEEDRRERISWNLKSAAAEVLPFIIVKDLLKKVREQINVEKDIQAYRVLQDSIGTPRFKRYLSNAVKKTSSQDHTTDAAILMGAIQSFFENRDLEKKEPIFKLSEDDCISILNKISSVEEYKSSTFSRDRHRIEDSLQRTAELREELQRSSIENFEEHVQKISGITTQIERLRDHQTQNEAELLAIQNEIRALEKILETSRKALQAELKKQSVSALSGRMLLLVEELQDQQYKKLITAVEKDLNQKFHELIRKDHFVDHIYLDQDFSLHLIRHQAVEVAALKLAAKKHGAAALKGSLKTIGYRALIEQLSATEESLSFVLADYVQKTIVLPVELDYTRFSNGEKQVLVMSLYWAIMNQSHNELPFIIDTPFARIDTEHRANITEKFFKELQGQLFVLSTNEELRHEHIVSLDQQISRVYMLEYGEDKRTRITEGSYFEVE